jgi:hypothetical protein
MGERDAFGREKDEDALAEMGWRGSPAPAAPAPPVLAAAVPPVAADPLPPRPAPAPPVLAAAVPQVAADPLPPRPAPTPRPVPVFVRRRRSSGPSLARLLIFVAVVAVAFIAVSTALDAGRKAVDGFGPIDVGGARVPSAPQSLYRAAALRAALDRLPAGRLVSLRVAAERIDAQVIRGGTRHLVDIRNDGRSVDVKAPAGAPQPRLKVDPAAPARFIRTAARRAGRPASTVEYVVLAEHGWSLFFADGVHYRANAAGRAVKRF